MTGIHFLLTYMCNRACDHCFVYSTPQAEGTFTIDRIRAVLEEICRIGTIETVYFEGGEPFLFYRTMIEGVRMASRRGFRTGIVTNAYWATSPEDAANCLEPLAEAGLGTISVSDDALHYGEHERAHWENAEPAATRLGIAASLLATEAPTVIAGPDGTPEVCGGVMFRGRAADRLADGLPRLSWEQFTECPAEELVEPGRVHLDAFGNVHICQGISMGNMWQTPLSRLISEYDAQAHPICGALVRGGPAALVIENNLSNLDAAVSACHLCYMARRALLERLSEYLCPRQLYGVE